MLVSSIQYSDSGFLQIIFHYRLLQDIECLMFLCSHSVNPVGEESIDTNESALTQVTA